jgi:glutamate-1-semialdehyde 2,1-aminomutase
MSREQMNIKKSLAMQERARNRIPGMTQLLSKRPDMYAEGVWPAYYQKAKGAEVWDLDGNLYIDMSISGIGANVLGYADPDVDKAVIEAIKNGSSCSLNCPEEIELADLLCEIHPWANMVRFARCGGEALAIAVRIARAHTGKDNIAFCGYHGWHDWYLAANLNSGDELDSHLITGLQPNGVPKVLANTAFPFRYNHIEELKSIIEKQRGKLSAIVIEAIRADQPLPGFWAEVRELANQEGLVLIIDEVSAGFRTVVGGAHQNFGLKPDIAVFSKAMGNGYPIAAIIGREEVMQSAQSTFISSTMWTERVGPVAALATIKKYKELAVNEHLVAIGSAIQRGWKEAAEKCELDIKVAGIAPLSHFGFDYPESLELKAFFIQLMLERGFLASNLFYAMYAHNMEHVGRYNEAVEDTFSIVKRVLDNGQLKKEMKGGPASSGFKRLA